VSTILSLVPLGPEKDNDTSAKPPPTCANPFGLRRSAGMKIVINGEDRAVEGPLTLSNLVEQLGMKPDRVAVELNLDIVPREQWLGTQLAEGDRLEIVHFVGGGAFCPPGGGL
jgi:sulfur carrier protein